MQKIINRVESGNHTSDDITCLLEFTKKFYPDRPIDNLFNYFCQRTKTDPKEMIERNTIDAVMARKAFTMFAYDELYSFTEIADKLSLNIQVVYKYNRDHHFSMENDSRYREKFNKLIEQCTNTK